MSFSLSVYDIDALRIRAELVNAHEARLAESRDSKGNLPDDITRTLSEERDAIDVGGKVAETLCRDALGGARPDFKVHVTISGHLNPGNVPAEGWSNDFISVQVTNASESVEAHRRRLEAEEAQRVADAEALAAVAEEYGPEEAQRLLEGIASGEIVAVGQVGPDSGSWPEGEAGSTPVSATTSTDVDAGLANEGEGDDSTAPGADAGDGAEATATASETPGDGGDSQDVAPDGDEPEPADESGSAAEDQPAVAGSAAPADDGLNEG